MRPDPLSEAAARRHELTRARAIQALRELDRAGTPVTFAGVAQAAGISRSWLYLVFPSFPMTLRLSGRRVWRHDAREVNGVPAGG